MKSILITGGAGFVGTNLITRLKEENYNIISIDNYRSGKIKNHQSNVEYIKGDTKFIDFLCKNKQIDVVFHLGEYSKIVPSFKEIRDVWKSNSQGTFNVLEFCRDRNIKLIYAGSSTKFSKEGEGHSPYTFTKSKNCDLIKYYSDWYGLKYSICYFYNVFGPYQDTCNNGYETVVSIFEKQYKQNLPLTVCGDGLQIRSFTYVNDIVDGLIKAWKYDKNEEFQFNNKNQYRIIDIAKMFSDNIKFIDARPGDRKEGNSNCNKSYTLLGWNTTLNVNDWIDMRKK